MARPLSAVAPLSKAAYSPGYAGQEQSIGKLAMVMKTVEQAMENMEYVRRLLRQKQPGFAASLELAASQLERSATSGLSDAAGAHPCSPSSPVHMRTQRIIAGLLLSAQEVAQGRLTARCGCDRGSVTPCDVRSSSAAPPYSSSR